MDEDDDDDDDDGNDPYIWLEEVESPESIAFAKAANEKCLAALGDPREKDTYKRVLAALETDERIPHVRMLGYHTETGDMLLYNFWRDAKNPKGIWRKTTMQSYKSANTEWTTVLDLDKLAKDEDISWVWKGYTALPRSMDDQSGGPMGRVTRVLLNLSRGGADATYLREFDLLTESFVDPLDATSPGFSLPEGKTRASYKSRDVLLVGADTGEDSMTNSGYPRTVREWKRGTKIQDAPIVFEVEKTDVSCSQYIVDESHLDGGEVYEMQTRSLSFYNKHYFVQKQLSSEPFVKLAVDLNAGVSFYGRWMLIRVKKDWEADDNGSDKTFKSGSFVYVDAQSFIDFSKAKEEGNVNAMKTCKLEYHVLFEPTATSSYSGYSRTRSHLVVYILDDVKEQLKFFKLGEGGGPFVHVGGDEQGQIRSVSASPVDSKTSDLIFQTTSSYISPSTLALVDANKIGQADYLISELKSLPEMFDSSDLEVTQKFAVSRDGTKIPYFMIYKKGMKLDGSTKTLLYGYGGFEVSLGPRYVTTVGISWLERGGVYVEANIRGGGEYGPLWHQQAQRENRNLCYEDFIAVAEHLVESKVCTPQTLACRGGSNGGLLTGNMLVQAPHLFNAIHIAVPLLDMKRYNKLLAGASWVAEYGDPDTDDWKNFLRKYSPYHNIDMSRDKYPHVLLTTSTRDDRVHPAHARKMVKKLWDNAKGKNWPVYYYENIEGGHGGAADSRQEAFMTTLSYEFMWRALTNSFSENV
jgi:prolyl oligopeptidase